MNDRLQRWLDAERRHSEGVLPDGESERWLTALFRALPYHSPTAALGKRVMLELGFTKPGTTPVAWAGRAMALVGLLVLATGFLALPTLTLRVLSSVGHLLGLALGALEVTGWWMVATVSIWQTLTELGYLISLVLATPEAMLGLALTTFTAVVAFWLLYNLTAHDRSSRYADST